MGKITYNDKVKINELTDVPAINKVQDVDMNEIKTSVNTMYDGLGLGTDTFSTSTSYVEGDRVVYNGMIYECITATSGAWNSANWSLVPVFVDENINKELLSKDIITAILTSNYTLTGTNVYGIIPLTLKSKIGDKLSMNSSGGIVIGAGVKFVKASSNVSYNSVAASGAKWNVIYKGTQALYPCPTFASNRVSISNAGGLIPVTQGDVIYLETQGATGDVLRGGTGNYYTCLTVEVVE